MNLLKTALFVPVAALVGWGCNTNYSQAKARDLATAHSCDWYQQCDDVGEGKKFANRNDCEASVAGDWNNSWPVSECDNKIPAEKLETCLKAIDITSCDNVLDFFNTLLNKCSKSQVCSGATGDGGN